jgi:hypothetical protein
LQAAGWLLLWWWAVLAVTYPSELAIWQEEAVDLEQGHWVSCRALGQGGRGGGGGRLGWRGASEQGGRGGGQGDVQSGRAGRGTRFDGGWEVQVEQIVWVGVDVRLDRGFGRCGVPGGGVGAV